MKEKNNRTCKDCGKDITHLHHNAVRCKNCALRRKKVQDKLRHKKKSLEKIKWNYFVEDPDTGLLTHRNAKGSKLRYWLDKICKELNSQELDLFLNFWDRRVKNPAIDINIKDEYRTCAGIVRDWRDYLILKEKIEDMSFDATSGLIYRPDGKFYTVDFDEEKQSYVVRDSEGTILYEMI